MIPDEVRRDIADCVALAKEWRKTWDSARRVEAWLDSQPVAPEPDWDSAPEWAQWWAVDANREARWFNEEPKIRYERWGDAIQIVCASISDGGVDLPIGIDWRTTLRRRPEANE